MRAALRNIDYLKTFAERILCENEISYSGDDLATIINKWGTPKEIDAFFDKKSIAFGNWLMQRNERTLEHPMEELMEAFNDYLAESPADKQIDYDERREHNYSNRDTHAPGSCPL